MIVALDPSSTRTGWARFTAAGRLFDGGYLRGARGERDYVDRVYTMQNELRGLLMARGPEPLRVIVIECPGPRVHRNNAGHGMGLPVYGFAVGALWATACETADNYRAVVVRALETEWTRGKPKGTRRAMIAAEFPGYRAIMAKDSGGDVSDAIGLGLWYLARCAVERARNG